MRPIPAILVHGGAGETPAATRSAVLRSCELAAAAGWQALRAGASALDAVTRAVTALEDDPLFNAGIGAVLNAAGEVELDASLMQGHDLRAGAVAAVRAVQNPIQLARRVLDEGRHVLLVAKGADDYAREQGMPVCSQDRLIVPRQHARWSARGTVGAVALDATGRLAAATSTGGIFAKRPGRVGDSALIGCGTYANAQAAVSCTGDGEAIIRMALAYRCTSDMAAGAAPMVASRAAIAALTEATLGRGGLIALDRAGRLGYACSTASMPIAYAHGGADLAAMLVEGEAAP